MTSKRILKVFGLTTQALIGVIAFNTVEAMEDLLVMLVIGLALSGGQWRRHWVTVTLP